MPDRHYANILVTVSVLVIVPGAYVGTYLALVIPFYNWTPNSANVGYGWNQSQVRLNGPEQPFLRVIFTPANLVDRQIRPDFWRLSVLSQ